MMYYLRALRIWWRARPRLFGVFKHETQLVWTGHITISNKHIKLIQPDGVRSIIWDDNGVKWGK